MINYNYANNMPYYNNNLNSLDNSYMNKNAFMGAVPYCNYMQWRQPVNNMVGFTNYSCPCMNNNMYYQYSPVANSVNPNLNFDNLGGLEGISNEFKLRTVPIDDVRD